LRGGGGGGGENNTENTTGKKYAKAFRKIYKTTLACFAKITV